MYPNPQDVLPLPPRPDLPQYRKRAKDLVTACRSGDTAGIRAWATRWIGDLIELQPESGGGEHRSGLERRIDQVADFARQRLAAADCALSQAQFVIARAHGFESWQRLVQHLEALSSESPVSSFEQAADAIVHGDLRIVQQRLRDEPALVRARSTREHRATLLHYVSANGVENYRQKTPPNIVDIARLLLDAGVEVDAEADVYGGDATTLGLVVTSAHPRRAGVQNALADLLLERGARMEAGIVRDCLANGCPEAAEHLVRRGALLDLEEAAGMGRIDVVKRYFDERSRPLPTTSTTDLTAALMMASWYDRVDVAEFLLDSGIDPGVQMEREGDGHTALHIAAYQGYSRLVELLLRRGAPVNVTDDTYGTPPLVWALHAWLVDNRAPAEPYKAVLRMLAGAGAEVKAKWVEDDRIRADRELFDMLTRRSTGQ
jgi:ankyrin repeat protein